jgi:ABC-type branched-subunit amino acid transport system ATPase component
MELATESVSKEFSGVRALSNITLRIEKGEVVGLIGPNGSGKTTLINILSGVIAPTSGAIRLGDDRWTRRQSHRVAHAGISRTFQTIRLFREMTVLENVEVAAAGSPRIKGLTGRRKASRRALAMLGIQALASRVASTLPYGLQRRVEFARAIVSEPHFLLLDEPAAGLNETESDELLQMLGDVREAVGCGVLLIDHDLRLIMRATHRIHVFNEGRMLMDGAPEEVRKDPRVIAAYLGTDAAASSRPAEADDSNNMETDEEASAP